MIKASSPFAIVLSALFLGLSISLFELTPLDLWIQDFFFQPQNNIWFIDRNNSLLKFLFYSGIKKLYILFIISIFIALVFFKNHPRVQKYRRGLIIVLLSCIAVPATINLLKAITHIPCPKDLERYGGQYPHISLFKSYPDDFKLPKNIRCYPAGHASGGFALMSLFFLFYRKRQRIIALSLAITLGWSIGLYKMMIGDHFFSHTLVSMQLSWLLIQMIYMVFILKIPKKTEN